MKEEQTITAIPKDVALRLCAEIRTENRGKWNLAAMQCWGCQRFSKGDPAKMCVANQAGYRGCNLVNARYDHELQRKI